MSPITKIPCATCGTKAEVGPGFSLPESGGALSVQGNVIQEFICGPCWAARPSTDWPCPGCRRANPDWMNWCLSCQTYRPDPRPHYVDWDLIGKEERERQREHDALVAEWDREYPGWRFLRREGRL